jgi:hypothetical protein
MDNNTNPTEQLVKIGGKSFGISHRWEMPEKYNSLTFPFAVRAKASEHGCQYAYINKKDGKSDVNKFGQYGLIPSVKELEKAPSLDLIVHSHASSWVKDYFEKNLAPDEWEEKDLDCSKLFVATVDNQTGVLTNPEFVISLVSSEGFISDSHASTDSSTFDNIALAERLETEFQLDPNLCVIAIDDDGEALSIAKHVVRDLHSEENKNRLAILSRPDFDKAASDKNALAERVYKPSQIKIKKVGLFIGVAAIGIAGTLLASYLTQGDARDYFEESSRWSELRQQEKQIDTIVENLASKGSKWDDRTYRKDVLTTFVDSLSNNLYSPNEIVSVIRHINIIFPNYASEWEFSDIRYEDNNFIVRYVRIPNGKGVYFMLDEHIEKLNRERKEVNIDIYGLNDDATEREYSVTPSIALSRQSTSSDLKKTMRGENAAEETLIEEGEDALKSTKRMLGYSREYENMPFLKKWFMFGGETLYSEAKMYELSSLKKESKEYNDALVAYNQQEKVTIDEDLIIGNKYDFVTMMQLDSFFEWTFPESNMSFPTKEMLKEKNAKPKKARRGKKAPKKVEIYGPSILGYNVVISTQSASDDSQITSYGIADMNRLGSMLNKPFVHVDKVEYSKIDEQWDVSIHFFTKTQFYESKVANYINKDV